MNKKIETEGYNSCWCFLSPEDCEYSPGTEEYNAWQTGYSRADNEPLIPKGSSLYNDLNRHKRWFS